MPHVVFIFFERTLMIFFHFPMPRKLVGKDYEPDDLETLLIPPKCHSPTNT